MTRGNIVRSATKKPDQTNGLPPSASFDTNRPVLPPAPALVTPKRQPKRLMIAAGVLVVVIGALAAFWFSQSATERIDVVAMAKDVAWGEQIQAEDLQRVEVVADPGITPLPWSGAASLVGKYAASKLWAGTLISSNAVTGQRVLQPGQALVGLSVKAGQMPTSSLQPGDPVQLVTVPEQNSTQLPPGPVAATVYRTSAAVSGGFLPVDVIVPQADAARVATVSAAGRIVIVLLPRS